MRFGKFGLALAIGLGLACSSEAGLSVTLSEIGFAPTTIVDNGVGDTNAAVGQIAFSGAYGSFSSVVILATSNAPGSSANAQISDLTVETRNSAAGTRTLTVTETDDSFTTPIGPGDPFLLTNDLAATLPSGRTATSFSSLDGTSTALASVTGVGAGTTSISGTRGLLPTFTLSNTLTVTLAASQFGSATVTTTAVLPEPATATAMMAGLSFLGAGAWLKRRKKHAVMG